MVSALRPHWLDDIFEDPSAAAEKFSAHERVAEAFEKAQKAFQSQKEAYEKNPQLVGPSPAQAARKAFLEALELQVKFE